MADNETQSAQPAQPEQPKKKHHIKRHKKKYAAGSVIAIVVALLQLWPSICPLLPFNIKCVDTKPLSNQLKDSFGELSDAGITL